MDGRRSPEFEREFLAFVERHAGLSGVGYAEQVADRLVRSERAYGTDSYLRLSMERIVKEWGEEALDIGGWALMGALASYAPGKMADEEAAHELRMVLLEGASYGPRLWRLTQRAYDLLQ